MTEDKAKDWWLGSKWGEQWLGYIFFIVADNGWGVAVGEQ